MILLAIDPGNIESAFVFVETNTYKPMYFAKEENEIARQHMIDYMRLNMTSYVAIEMIASYGMAVGKSVFDTCVEIGVLKETFRSMFKLPVDYIYRKDEKMCICGQMKAKDSNIRRALIDRFAKHDLERGTGTKANPDWFYGFKKDIWSAYAVAVSFLDMREEKANEYSAHKDQ